MTNLNNNDFILINKLLISNINLFTHEELLVILFLHSGQKSISFLRSKLAIPQSKFQKSISFLENNGFIVSKNEIYSLGKDADFSNLTKRDTRNVGALDLGEREETSSLVFAVQDYKSFASSIQMPSKCRQLSFMMFDRMGWDTSRPFDRIINIPNWLRECRQLLALANDDLRIIRDAIDTLKEKEYTVASPRSLFKTVASIKNGSQLNFSKPKKDDDSAPEIF